MAHTPGPWTVEVGMPFDYPPPSGKRNPHCIVGVGKGTIASPFHHVADAGIVSDDEVYANARLIAAAPELLEACQAVADYDIPGRDAGPLMSKVLAAIAKATGETS